MPHDLQGFALLLVDLLSYALFARALLSWFDPALRWAISRALFDVTEPIVAPVRQVIPTAGGLDFSLIVAAILIRVILRPMLAHALY